MKASDTVMEREDILSWIGLSPGFPLRTKEQRMAVYLTLAARQAEISFKAGYDKAWAEALKDEREGYGLAI